MYATEALLLGQTRQGTLQCGCFGGSEQVMSTEPATIMSIKISRNLDKH